jgi:hypothetical protein
MRESGVGLTEAEVGAEAEAVEEADVKEVEVEVKEVVMKLSTTSK